MKNNALYGVCVKRNKELEYNKTDKTIAKLNKEYASMKYSNNNQPVITFKPGFEWVKCLYEFKPTPRTVNILTKYNGIIKDKKIIFCYIKGYKVSDINHYEDKNKNILRLKKRISIIKETSDFLDTKIVKFRGSVVDRYSRFLKRELNRERLYIKRKKGK